MAISKKNSRTISVDGSEFRWVVFQNSGWNDLTVQSDSGKGKKLIVQFAWETKNGAALPNQAITPAVVAEAILFARKNGWDSNASGAPFQCKHQNGAFVVRNSAGESGS